MFLYTTSKAHLSLFQNTLGFENRLKNIWVFNNFVWKDQKCHFCQIKQVCILDNGFMSFQFSFITLKWLNFNFRRLLLTYSNSWECIKLSIIFFIYVHNKNIYNKIEFQKTVVHKYLSQTINSVKLNVKIINITTHIAEKTSSTVVAHIWGISLYSVKF